MIVRLLRVDDGHFLVPDTDWEVVREPDGYKWAVWRGNEKLQVFQSYKEAREWALNA